MSDILLIGSAVFAAAIVIILLAFSNFDGE